MTSQQKAQSLPEDLKLKVKEAIVNIEKDMINPSRTDVSTIFKVYNDHIDKSIWDVNCQTCRYAIFKFWKNNI